MDLYKVLGVRREATREEVKAAFRKVALQFHPDRHAHASKLQQEAAARRFREASDAYQVLVDPLKRALYNRDPPPYAAPSSPPRNHWHHHHYHYHASSPPHRPLWTLRLCLRLSLSPFDVAFHALLAGALDKLTVKNRFPMPHIDYIWERLKGAKVFSKIDLKSDYHQDINYRSLLWRFNWKSDLGGQECREVF